MFVIKCCTNIYFIKYGHTADCSHSNQCFSIIHEDKYEEDMHVEKCTLYDQKWSYNGGWTLFMITHWGRETHICISKLATIGSGNGLLPGRYQAIIWTNAGILLIGPIGTIFNETIIKILIFSFKKMHIKCRLWNLAVSICVLALIVKYSTLYMMNIRPFLILTFVFACRVSVIEISNILNEQCSNLDKIVIYLYTSNPERFWRLWCLYMFLILVKPSCFLFMFQLLSNIFRSYDLYQTVFVHVVVNMYCHTCSLLD